MIPVIKSVWLYLSNCAQPPLPPPPPFMLCVPCLLPPVAGPRSADCLHSRPLSVPSHTNNVRHKTGQDDASDFCHECQSVSVTLSCSVRVILSAAINSKTDETSFPHPVAMSSFTQYINYPAADVKFRGNEFLGRVKCEIQRNLQI